MKVFCLWQFPPDVCEYSACALIKRDRFLPLVGDIQHNVSYVKLKISVSVNCRFF